MTTKEKEVSKNPKEKKNVIQDQSLESSSRNPPIKRPTQPANPAIDPLKDEKDKNESLIQKFMSSQSSNFSSVSRTLMFGIIGTIWVLTYSDGNLEIPNIWLLISLIMSLIYFLADIGHYFLDTMSYQEESKKVWDYSSPKEIEDNVREGLTKINERSVNFIKIKFALLILTAIIFGIGLFLQISM